MVVAVVASMAVAVAGSTVVVDTGNFVQCG
jgi:hypothetical protein